MRRYRRYAPTHKCHGEIDFFENGKLVRREYAPTHKCHGEIDLFENGKHVRRYAHNRCHGQIHVIENDKLVCVMFLRTHERYGEIHFCENGTVVRIEYARKHKDHGYIDFYDENGKHVRRSFSKPVYNNHDHQKHPHATRAHAEAEMRRMKQYGYEGSERLNVYYNRDYGSWYVGRSSYR